MQQFFSNYLANNGNRFIFAVATVIKNLFSKCQYTRYIRPLPGLAFGLVTVAVPNTIPAGRSCLRPSHLSRFQKPLHMLTTQELTAHLERITRLHQQVLTQLQDKGYYQPKKGIVIPFPVGAKQGEVAHA